MASDSIVDERTLREIYLTSFEMVVKEAQPKTIMSAYNLVNGTYANENAHLLMDILRRNWGFDGAVVTDWGGSNDHALGVKNGSTLEMPAPRRGRHPGADEGGTDRQDHRSRRGRPAGGAAGTGVYHQSGGGRRTRQVRCRRPPRIGTPGCCPEHRAAEERKQPAAPCKGGEGGGHRRLCPDAPLSGCRFQRRQLHQGGFLSGLPCRKRPEHRRLRQGL